MKLLSPKELDVLKDLSTDEVEIIYIAIENHNKFKIISGLTDRTKKYANL